MSTAYDGALARALVQVAWQAKLCELHTIADHAEGIASALALNGATPRDAQSVLDQIRGALFTLTDLSHHLLPERWNALREHLHHAIEAARLAAGEQ